MRNWRELGEVPDSDDDDEESLDYLESQHDQAQQPADQEPPSDDTTVVNNETAPLRSETPKPAQEVDIWDLPSSGDQTYPSRPSTAKKTRRNSTRPVLPTAIAQDQIAQEPASSFATQEKDDETTPKPDERPAAEVPLFLDDEISTGYVRISGPEPHFPPISIPSSPLTPLCSPELPRSSPAQPRDQEAPTQTQPQEIPAPEAEELSSQTGVRLQRSLRQRKPIQQHPYLLEDVNYRQTMKHHGIKPVKVVVSSEPAGRRPGEEESQEQEFETEESQEKSQERSHGDGTQEEDTLLPIFEDDTGDRDELALSPSPPKTSPGDRLLQASSQTSNGNNTDITNFSGEEEFPSVDRLKPRAAGRALKRQPSQLLSSKSKRRKAAPDSLKTVSPHRALIIPDDIDAWDLSPSPPQSRAGPQDMSQDLAHTPRSPIRNRTAAPRSALQRAVSSSLVQRQAADFPVFEDEEGGHGDSSDSESSAMEGSSSEEEEAIIQNSRKIRGVLPASWLRLDQKKDSSTIARNRRQSLEFTPAKTPKRGVALPKQPNNAPPSTANPFIFNESEESDSGSTPAQPVRDGVPQAARNVIVIDDDDDDGASVEEEDHIDRMLPGRKRTATSGLSRGAKKQKRKAKPAFGQVPGHLTRQPKITQVLGRSKPTTDGTPTRNGTAKSVHRRSKGTSPKHASRKRTSTPPLLSILDVMEPTAPQFIKIAARTARQKRNLGKGSPSKKMISLATRQDNVDALSALQDWKSGRTRPRVTVSSAKPPSRSTDVSRPALEEMSANVAARPSHGVRPRGFSLPTDKLVRQSNLDGFVTATHDVQQTSSKPTLPVVHKRKVARKRAPSFRPAQLETNDGEGQGSRLASKKRSLDALFRQSRKAHDASSTHSLAHSFHDSLLVRENTHEIEDESAIVDTTAVASKRTKENNKSRFRKRKAPQYIDLETPRYERARDPLPPVVISIPEDMAAPEIQDKLKGLGPYGTHYTPHFEVFPLEHGTFFHESTIIGRGYLNKATEEGLSTKIHQHRPIVSFMLDEQVLRWGRWDDKTSSEFGILFDWISEKLSSGKLQGDQFSSRKTSEAAGFVLGYILDSLSVETDAEQGAFVLRCVEVLTSFTSRFESFDWSENCEQAKMALLEVLVRFLVALLAIHPLSRSPGEVESLLTRLASLAIKSLLGFGLEELRTLYNDLQRLSARERGIRPRQVLVNCWVVVMRVLESASIPRSSFWDVTHAIMLKSGVASGLDTQAFERLWQDTFTLLPLGEIDNSGILVPGLRNTIPLEGWTLPQRLMKRVFQVYKLNPRQPPSFNEYCRALVARCHCLVQLWGWRKCTGIIGTIFDFFGSQSLAHLRNEEVYRSPRFIEELHHNPSLAIEPADRCFHIFIKMLGLVIQRLRQLGRENEVKNLVTRTLPNHNRQYLKEDTIHQHDLAALRNHHDLLCTLFWAAPADQRPSIRLIEKLVTPSSAHKEACIINIKAWNQLARFVVSKGEGCDAFRPFGLWRNNIFNQVLDQYLSAASDIEQQFRALSEQMRGIKTDMRDVMIAKNKATAMDVLHSSVRASLDVLKHAPTLGSTVYCFNTTQLQKVFTSLDYRSAGFDWSVLRAALDTVELYLSRLDEASDDQYASEVSDDYDPSQIEDAILLLHDKLAKDFFWMARTTLGLPLKLSSGKQTQQAVCAEKTVTIASRIAIKFINNGLAQLSAFFNPGKFGLFPDLPKNLHGQERIYLPLFIATLAKNHMFDFRSIESSMLELWVLSILKPARVLKYENYLAETLHRKTLPFLERATVLVGAKPDYNTSIAYFSCALHHMRKSLRDAGSTRSKQDRDEYAKVLHLAMQKMKADLSLLRTEEAEKSGKSEHKAYIGFVRQVISLMKSHGVGICVIDPFFTQPGLDYSPPLQDPRMHTDGIIAYGVRLGEKEVTAVPQLFHYLYNNFKIALGNDKLDQESRILLKAMKNTHTVSFVLQYMIPAIVQASSQIGEAWILLETYVAALARMLTRSSVSKELVGEDIEHAVTGVLASILAWLGELRDKTGYGKLSVQQLYVLNLLVTLANAIRPSLETYLFLEGDPGGFSKSDVEDALDSLATVFADAHSQIGDELLECEQQPAAEDTVPGIPSSLADKVRVNELLSGLPPPSATMRAGAGGQRNQRVQEFVRHIVADVRKNWIVTDGLVTVRMVATGGGGRMGLGGFSSTQGQSTPAASQVGTKCRLASADDLVRGLYAGLGAWSLGKQAGGMRNKSEGGGRGLREELIF